MPFLIEDDLHIVRFTWVAKDPLEPRATVLKMLKHEMTTYNTTKPTQNKNTPSLNNDRPGSPARDVVVGGWGSRQAALCPRPATSSAGGSSGGRSSWPISAAPRRHRRRAVGGTCHGAAWGAGRRRRSTHWPSVLTEAEKKKHQNGHQGRAHFFKQRKTLLPPIAMHRWWWCVPIVLSV